VLKSLAWASRVSWVVEDFNSTRKALFHSTNFGEGIEQVSTIFISGRLHQNGINHHKRTLLLSANYGQKLITATFLMYKFGVMAILSGLNILQMRLVRF
jgi:hypothetical protein